MSIIRNFNEGRMDSLRTINYTETGIQSPFVTKDINNPPNERGLLSRVIKGVDDLTRVSKLLTNTPGVKFIANEGLLKQGDLTKKLQGNDGTKAGNIIRRVGGTVKHIAQVVGSTLAQVPLNGTGTHFIRGFRTDTYLQDNVSRSGFASFFGAGGIEGSQFALKGEPVPSRGLLTDSTLPNNTTVLPGSIGKETEGIQGNRKGLDFQNPFDTDNTYYQGTNTAHRGIIANGLVFPQSKVSIENDDIKNISFIQTTNVPFSIGIDKSSTGIIDSQGNEREFNPALITNNLNPSTVSFGGGFFSTATVIPLSRTKLPTEQNIIAVGSSGIIPLKTDGRETTSQIAGSQLNNVSGEITSLLTTKDPNILTNTNVYSDGSGYIKRFQPLGTSTKTIDRINTVQDQSGLPDIGGKPISAIPLRANENDFLFNPISNSSVGLTDSSLTSNFYKGNVSSISSSKSLNYIEDFRSPDRSTKFFGEQDSTPSTDERKIKTYSFDYNKTTINKETRVGLGNQGSLARSRVSYTTPDDTGLTVDALNALDVQESALNGGKTPELGTNGSRDLIQLEFQVLTPDKTFYLAFRAYLDSFDDSYNASWNTSKYLGRADNFYTYSGFERSINIGFKIAASSEQEMKPLYRKAATLASVTAPTYGDNGRFMRGSIAKVTVGDYIYQQPGIIESVQYTWQRDYPWEISFTNPETGGDTSQILPHVLDVSLSFKVIHDFLPETGIKPFITNHNASEPKEKYISL